MWHVSDAGYDEKCWCYRVYTITHSIKRKQKNSKQNAIVSLKIQLDTQNKNSMSKNSITYSIKRKQKNSKQYYTHNKKIKQQYIMKKSERKKKGYIFFTVRRIVG